MCADQSVNFFVGVYEVTVDLGIPNPISHE